MTYTDIEAGDVDTSVLDLTGTRSRYRVIRGGRSGMRRGGGEGVGGGRRRIRRALPVSCGIRQLRMGSRAEGGPQSFMVVRA